MELTDKETYKTEHVPIDFTYNEVRYSGEAIPVSSSCQNGACFDLEIVLNDKSLGMIHSTLNGWRMEHIEDQQFVDKIGEEIFLWYGITETLPVKTS